MDRCSWQGKRPAAPHKRAGCGLAGDRILHARSVPMDSIVCELVKSGAPG